MGLVVITSVEVVGQWFPTCGSPRLLLVGDF